MNIAVLCSGKGSNLQAIINAAKQGYFDANIAIMICDNPDAYAIEIAKKEQISHIVLDRKLFKCREEFENRILAALKASNPGLICLAGYMRLLSPNFVGAYKNRIINIHPALLPAFKGANGIKDALDYGVKITGVTVHFVTDDVDTGPIILQEAVAINENDTEESLRERIHEAEHRLYPEAIRLFAAGKIKINGRKVLVV
jgi:phosphoribosylglycinamide formyltransferase 1